MRTASTRTTDAEVAIFPTFVESEVGSRLLVGNTKRKWRARYLGSRWHALLALLIGEIRDQYGDEVAAIEEPLHP